MDDYEGFYVDGEGSGIEAGREEEAGNGWGDWSVTYGEGGGNRHGDGDGDGVGWGDGDGDGDGYWDGTAYYMNCGSGESELVTSFKEDL